MSLRTYVDEPLSEAKTVVPPYSARLPLCLT